MVVGRSHSITPCHRKTHQTSVAVQWRPCDGRSSHGVAFQRDACIAPPACRASFAAAKAHDTHPFARGYSRHPRVFNHRSLAALSAARLYAAVHPGHTPTPLHPLASTPHPCSSIQEARSLSSTAPVDRGPSPPTEERRVERIGDKRTLLNVAPSSSPILSPPRACLSDHSTHS